MPSMLSREEYEERLRRIEDGVLAAEQSESGHVRLLYRKLLATIPEVEE
jgi:hypothetical protein